MLTIYKASAGSGKTFTLAYEYVKILLGLKPASASGHGHYVLNSRKYSPDGHRHPDRHRGILAITFTNKATEEMKTRIVKELNLLCSLPSDGRPDTIYAGKLVSEFGCSREELRDAAQLALRELLCDYSSFFVSTIDSFFQTVLRTFAREVDHQGDYAIETDDRYAVACGIGLMLDDLNSGEAPDAAPIVSWISSFMMARIAEGKKFNIFNRSARVVENLAAYVGRACDETFRARRDEIMAYLADNSKVRALKTLLQKRSADDLARLRDAAMPLPAMLEAEGFDPRVVPASVRTLMELALNSEPVPKDKLGIGDDSKAKTNKKVRDASPADGSSIYVKTYARKISAKEYLYPSTAFGEALTGFVRLVYDLHVDRVLCSRLAVAAENLEFLGYVWRYIDTFRKENNLILLSDTNDLLDRIIKDAEMPFIYERLGMRLTNLLIDEFQDTSHLQWKNLRPLVGNSIAEGHDSLIIGDEKQAIYRFRNSDSALLHHLVASRDFPDSHIMRGSLPEENTNYRSAPGIVEFNNRLFESLAATFKVDGYENVRQNLPARASAPSYVSLRFFGKAEAAAASGSVAEDRDPRLELMCADILRQHREGGYSWRDIVILVRGRREAVRIADYIRRHYPAIALLSDEALLLNSSGAVRQIVSMLKLVDRSYAIRTSGSDDGGADSAPVYASRGDIVMMISRFDFYIGEGLSPEDALRKALGNAPEAGSQIHEDVAGVRAENPSNPVALVETIVARKISPARRAAEQAYISAFQDVLIEYCALNNPSLHGFLNWWDARKETLSLSSAPEADAVGIMTIHKAKGLEWPCVHLPYADWEMYKPAETLWLDTSVLDFIPENLRPPMLRVETEELFGCESSPFAPMYLADRRGQIADNLNVAYVAFTRAVSELCVMCDPAGNLGAAIAGAFPEEAVGGCVLCGEPTVKPTTDAPSTGACACRCEGYEVVFRDDARELITVEDATSEAGAGSLDIGGEADKEINDSPARRQMAERGTNLHNILASMLRRGDLPRAVAEIAASCRLDSRTADEYSALLEEAFAAGGALVEEWFSDAVTVLAERSIYDAGSGETFRPDRVMLYPGGRTVVVDYKFTSETRPSHLRQVKMYLALLARMGHAEADGYLWYPALGKIIKV